MELIDIYEHSEEGYNPFLITERWQAALLNYSPGDTLEGIDRLDTHHQTDEVFVLMKGKAALIAAVIEGDHINYEVIDMEPNRVYNIRKEVWHRIDMQPGSQVLIVEDQNTHLGDFEFYPLNDQQKQQLVDAVQAALEK